MTKPLSNQNSYRQHRYGKSKREIIIESIINDITDGRFARGAQIPNRKLLAGRFKVNTKTIDRAINQLISRKVLYVLKGIGTFVDQTALLASDLIYSDRFLRRKVKSRLPASESTYFQLGSHGINPFYFLANCMKSISTLTLRLINQSADKWAQSYTFREKLTLLMREDLSAREGKYYREDNFIVLQGRYHAIESILRLVINQGDIAVLAEPVPIGLLTVLRQVGAEVWTLPRTEKGIEAIGLTNLYRKATIIGKNIKLVYTNLQTDYAELQQGDIRRAMLKLLNCTERLGMLLLEEYEDHELSYQRQIVFSDISTKPVGHVVSIRSFGKMLGMYNELRMILAPRNIIEALLPAKESEINYGTLYEKLAIRILQKNIFAKVSIPVTLHYRNVRDTLITYCERRLKDWVDVVKPNSGCTMWLIAKSECRILVPVYRLQGEQTYWNFDGPLKEGVAEVPYLLLGFGEGNSRNMELALEYIAQEMNGRYNEKKNGVSEE